jgi:hypothetical protein
VCHRTLLMSDECAGAQPWNASVTTGHRQQAMIFCAW